MSALGLSIGTNNFLIDQLLAHSVMADVSGRRVVRPAARPDCSRADPPAHMARSDMRISRNELEDAMREPLERFVTAMENTLRCNGIRDLVAAASVGAGANTPALATALSARFDFPVVTMPHAQLAAAQGAALWASHRPEGRPGETDGHGAAPGAPRSAAPVESPGADPAESARRVSPFRPCPSRRRFL